MAFSLGNLLDRCLQITQAVRRAGVVLALEGHQLGQDVMPSLQTRMMKDLPARDDLVGDAAEAQADFDMRVPRILLLLFPSVRENVEVMVAFDEVVRHTQDGGAQSAIAALDQWAIGPIDFITLITSWPQPRATSDGATHSS